MVKRNKWYIIKSKIVFFGTTFLTEKRCSLTNHGGCDTRQNSTPKIVQHFTCYCPKLLLPKDKYFFSIEKIYYINLYAYKTFFFFSIYSKMQKAIMIIKSLINCYYNGIKLKLNNKWTNESWYLLSIAGFLYAKIHQLVYTLYIAIQNRRLSTEKFG